MSLSFDCSLPSVATCRADDSRDPGDYEMLGLELVVVKQGKPSLSVIMCPITRCCISHLVPQI